MDEYFQNYEDLDVHQLMLDDKPRIAAYKNAIFNSKDMFKNKIVMDVGAGTGILSAICAQAGAKLVYAVEASNLAKIAETMFIENQLQETIKVIHDRIENVDTNTIQKVDIIVSEWMGFYLLHEGMLDSVLFARDNFLQEDGTLFPCVAALYVSLCELPSMYEFWDDVCGVSMKCIGKKYREAKTKKPEILLLDRANLLTEEKLLAWLDLRCISTEELNYIGQENVLVCTRDGRFQGICVWFSVEFPDGSRLCTGPFHEPTHWKQTTIVLPEDVTVTKDEPVAFKLELKRNMDNPRRYDMELILNDAEEVEHDVPCTCHMTKCIVTRTYLEQLDQNTERTDS